MKCINCNSDVAEGMHFCPYCGSPIEIMQPQRCTHCNTELTEGAKFCPNCGSPVEQPKPKVCPNCGEELEGGEYFCSHCGHPVQTAACNQAANHLSSSPNIKGQASKENGMSTLKLVWDQRRMPIWNNPILLHYFNQKQYELIPKEAFETTLNHVPSSFDLQIEYGKGSFNKTDVHLSLEPRQNYTCSFFYNPTGSFGYELRDQNGRIVKEDGNINYFMFLIFLAIPLIGFLYFFIKKDVQPIAAKAGVLLGFSGLIVYIILYLFVL